MDPIFPYGRGQPPLRPDEPIAIVEGFNVHAARTFHGADHAQVERFVRSPAHPHRDERNEAPRAAPAGTQDKAASG